MKVRRQNLSILIDGLLKGGAETLVLAMLPFFKKKFKKIEIYFIDRGEPFSSDFQKYAVLHPISFWKILSLVFSKNEASFYVNLAKPLFIVNLFVFFLGNRGNKLYCHEHTSQSFFSQQNGVYKLLGHVYLYLVKSNLKNARLYYIVSSRADLRYFLDLGIKSEYLILFPNSILQHKINFLSKIRRSYRVKKDIKEIKCFTLCRLAPIKQLEWCIEAIYRVACARPQITFKLYIWGTGGDFARLNDIINSGKFFKKNLEIYFQGYVPSATDYLKNCDFYLLSSKVEGSPLSLTEAACSGINCISTPSSPAILELCESFPNIHVCSENSLESFSELFMEIVTKHLSTPKLGESKVRKHFNSLDENMIEFLEKF